jgi:hypothetical protein
MARITLYSSDFGCYEIARKRRKDYRGPDGATVLVQTDWDYPGVASTFGWRPRKRRGCAHDGTDGTVDCRGCGLTAGEMIASAGAFLDRIADTGRSADDPGYLDS